MANPGELMRRAARNREQLAARPASSVSAPIRNIEEESREAPAVEQPVRAAPMDPPHAGHASYSALMRSHDRIRTCHLGG